MSQLRAFLVLLLGVLALALPAGAAKEGWALSHLRPSVASAAGRIEPTVSPRAWRAEGDQPAASFGLSVAKAGDVNGDGFDDAIVGAYLYDNGQTDEGRAFVYHGSASGLSTSPSWTAESNLAFANFGNSVGMAGDVNGDGFDDVIVGAWLYDESRQHQEGQAFVFHGSTSGLSTIPNWNGESDQDSAHFGLSVGTAGDVNGDGFDDVIVGAESFDHEVEAEGRAYVYHGSAAGLSTTPSWIEEGDQDFAYFGASVGTAGDVNADGYADVIVGAKQYDHPVQNEGRAFVYHGSAAGLSTVPGWTADSGQVNAEFGESVATAGDVNGDGFDDVIVGARFYANGQSGEGRAFVYHGSTAGLSTSPDWTAESNQSAAIFGGSVRTAGDVNGDGFDDVIVGAYLYQELGQRDEGRAFGYLGSAAGLSPTAFWTGESNQRDAFFGVSVGTAGDVNGDGFDEVIVGSFGYDRGETDEGAAFVFGGRAIGQASRPDGNT